MPSNHPEYMKAYKQKHYAANKEKYIQQAIARKRALMEEVRLIKSVPCMDCGIQYNPWIMQFDHREGTIKTANVSQLVNNVSRVKLMAEITKCDIVCSNCHAERTYRRRQATFV